MARKKKTTDKKGIEWNSFHENGKRYMQCKQCQNEYCEVESNIVAVTCSDCVQRKCLAHMPMESFSLRNIRRLDDQLVGIGWQSLLIKMVMCFIKVKNNLN